MPNARSPHDVLRALGNRYRIEGELGTGGMARVFRARDSLLAREVAIKVFRARADTAEELRAQEAEAKLVASLNHHALTTLFDAGVDTSDPDHPQVYLVMEYIEGPDLKRRLQRGTITPQQVAYLGFDLAEALDYVHENGFLHRDIKPANVLLADRRGDVRLRGKLADFGIASLIGRAETSEYTTGTAAYLSPEQVEGDDAVPGSDVYALGLVLLEALTGTVAFPGSVTSSALARLDADPAIPAHVPAELARVLRGMTARRPRDRMPLAEVTLAFQGLLVDDLARHRPAAARAPEPADESARLAALQRYGILESPPDDAFAAVTRLAVRLTGAPIAFVTIVERDRVRLTARVGTDVSEVARGHVVSGLAARGRPWAVPDLAADPAHAAAPLLAAMPGARAYAAAPLTSHDGHVLGALCVVDTAARSFPEAQLQDLGDLAAVVMRELELRVATRRALFDR